MFCRYFLPFYVIYGTVDFFLLINNKWSVLFILQLSYYQIISGLYYCIIMIFCVILYHKTPNWEDHCFIRAEMKLGSLIWFICLIFYVIDGSTFLMIEIINKETNEYVQNIIAIYIGLIFFTLYGLIITFYPTKKVSLKPADLSRVSSPDQIEMVWNEQQNKKLYKRDRDRALSAEHSVQSSRSFRSRALSEPTLINDLKQQHKNGINSKKNGKKNIHSKDDEIITILRKTSANKPQKKKKKNINNKKRHNKNNGISMEFDMTDSDVTDLNTLLSDILSDGVLFDVWMAFLSRSFSTEICMSYIEFYQYKVYIILQFENEILNQHNKLFIQRLKSKVQSKRNKNNRNFIRKLRYKHALNGTIPSNEPVTHNILLPDTVPKSYLVFGDFMVVRLTNGKSLKKSMGGLERDASKFGNKLYRHQQKEKQRNHDNNNNNKLSHAPTSESSKSKQNNNNKELSKTPSKNNNEISKSEPSEKSKSDRLDAIGQMKYQHSNSKSINKLVNHSSITKLSERKGRSSMKPKYPQIPSARISRKESTTVISETTFAGSYNSVRLQIPDSAYTVVREMDSNGNPIDNINIHASMESVTEKDIYDDIKVGTPSMVCYLSIERCFYFFLFLQSSFALHFTNLRKFMRCYFFVFWFHFF